MSLWIVTVGSSDVQLSSRSNWYTLFEKVRSELECEEFSPQEVESEAAERRYVVPGRVLGLVYGTSSKHEDLVFPLLDAYTSRLLPLQPPSKVVFLLTDQSNLALERRLPQSPYWQDTCTLAPLLAAYIHRRLNLKPQMLILTPPKGGRGIDHWDATLKLVGEQLMQLTTKLHEPVYVSHQAGTPALSSAVQFMSLSQFGEQVRFLVVNRFDSGEPVECIESSRYLRGIRAQEARRLVVDGIPGAALNLLTVSDSEATFRHPELVKLVNFFNLRSTGTGREKDFDLDQVAQRLFEALELISIFFHQRNYLTGITLLAAAHELFLKAAVIRALTTRSEIVIRGNSLLLNQLIEWNEYGLRLKKSELLIRFGLPDDKDGKNWGGLKEGIDKCLNYPKPALNRRFFDANANLLPWLKALRADFVSWPLLNWICDDKRSTEQDLRNQLMHNLRGIEEEDVVRYLLAGKQAEIGESPASTYRVKILEPFLAALELVGSVDKDAVLLDHRLNETAKHLVHYSL